MKLDGMWRAAPATDALRRDGLTLDVDDAHWPEVPVPGHWRTTGAYHDSDGPLLYRRRYHLAEPAAHSRRWITFDGLFYQADVWLDGAYLGDPEGYFVPRSFDITALSRIGDEHVVAAEITCAPQLDPQAKRNITGIFQNWDGIARDWNPGGIWRNVHIYDTGPVKIDRYRVLCRDANPHRAHLLLSARLDALEPDEVVIRTLIDGEVADELRRRLARGANDVSWSIDIADPKLWWPRSLGDQPLTDVAVQIVVGGEVSDERSRRTGMREVAWNNWTCSVNGERLFLKGANLLPPRVDLANATPADCRRDVELAVEAGLDVVRMHGHIGRRATYEAADEVGLLIMQDFPLQWGYQRSIRGAAVEQATAAVDELGHHPSIVQWSAHNDPTAAAIGLGDTPQSRARYVAAHQLPTWNKSVLDRWVKRSLERADPTRLVSPHSGVLPHLPLVDGTDTHFYFGWYHGEVGDLHTVAQRVPRVIRFVSEFGAQAAPTNAPFIDEQLERHEWPDLDWDILAEQHGLQKWVFDQRVPPADYATFTDWREATQRYQARLLKTHIELLRRYKYQPAGGFSLFSFNDASPMVSWSIYDHERSPKLALDAVRNACAPAIAIIDGCPPLAAVGSTLQLDAVVVNDLHRPINDAVLDIEARWVGGNQRWRFGGDVGADSVTAIASVDMQVPDVLGRLDIQLSLHWPGGHHRNDYSLAVTRPAV